MDIVTAIASSEPVTVCASASQYANARRQLPAHVRVVEMTCNYANAVPAAHATVDPAILADPGTYPPAAVRAQLSTKNDNAKAFNRALTRAFSRLKSGL